MQQTIVKRARMLAGAVGLVGLTLGSDAAMADSLTRTTTFTYDANSGLMTQSVVEPNNATFRVQSDFEYDAFGNLKKTTVSGANIDTRISQAGYDTQGRFPTTLTNALSHVTTQAFSAAFGEVTSLIDPNQVQSTVTLDTWGRKTLVVNGDGTRTSFQYQYCSGINGGTEPCPANGAYRVVAVPRASDGVTQIGSSVATYFDRLDREIVTYTQSLNGEQIRVNTQYDALGRVQQTSRPYFVVGGTPRWTTFTYDTLDRVTLEVRPDAGTIQHAYHGLSVTDTNQLSQTLTTVKNSRGEVVSVTDNLSQVTSFAYDPFGNLETTTDPASNVIGNTYDLYGRKTAMSDPDMGNWSYGYDVLGQLTSQTNARSQTVTLTYDKLGRLTGRTEPDLSSSWTYDTQVKGIGKLATASTTAGFQHTVTYDSLSRPIQTAVTVDGSTYNTASTYNGQGKLGTVTYPSGVGITYSYNTIGYLTSISDTATSAPYWTANAYDAELHLTQQTFGNGIQTNKVYTATTGRISTIQAGAGNSIQNLGFTFNTLGNVTQRVDAITQTTDDLSYDGLNRLTQAITSNPSLPLNVTKTVAYNAIGNITTKSDVGTYTYDPARVHAVASIAPGGTGTVTASYIYDANGNMLEGRGRTVTWTSFDMVSQITQGTNWVSFTYDSEHARLKQLSSDGATKYYLNDSTSGAMAEKIVGASQSVTWNNYIMLGGEMVALKATGATSQTRYFHKDHLGSIVALTDETGAVVERDSFDAWGQRRTPAGQDDPLYPGQSITSQISRGYTGHEQLDSVGLVHMNGRIYEPIIGKMMSPDPTVPDSYDGQAYNRYAYVLNNPLSLTDLSGFRPDYLDDRDLGPSGSGGGHDTGTPDHKSTDFRNRDEWEAAGDLSNAFGVPITTRADLYSAIGALNRLFRDSLLRNNRLFRDALLRNQIACQAACDGLIPSLGYGDVNGWNYEYEYTALGWSFPGTRDYGYRHKNAINSVDFPFETIGWKGALKGGISIIGTLGKGTVVELRTFFRTMSPPDFAQMLKTGKIPATGETFVTESVMYAKQYKGITVRLDVRASVYDDLMNIGVTNVRGTNLPLVQKGWGSYNAYFKAEGELTNIGLGKGTALDIFNDSIMRFNRVP